MSPDRRFIIALLLAAAAINIVWAVFSTQANSTFIFLYGLAAYVHRDRHFPWVALLMGLVGLATFAYEAIIHRMVLERWVDILFFVLNLSLAGGLVVFGARLLLKRRS